MCECKLPHGVYVGCCRTRSVDKMRKQAPVNSSSLILLPGRIVEDLNRLKQLTPHI